MTKRHLPGLVPALAVLAIAGSQPALAHVGLAAHTHGFAEGFAHPLTGLDHLAAMVAVGLWSATLGGRAVLAVPVAFVALLVAGALVGGAGVALPAVEHVITGSVIVLGLLVALGVRLPIAAAAAVVGLFGLFHGHAHGAEMPEVGSPLGYGAGFVLATALLHGAGIAVGLGLGRLAWRPAARVAGAVIALSGVVLALAA